MSDTPTDRETVEQIIARMPVLTSIPPQETYVARTLRALLDERDAAIARAEALEAERAKLLPWARLGVAAMEGWPETGDIDGFMLQDMAVNCGVLKEIPGGYDPEQHFDSVGVGPERGDPWFEIVAVPSAAQKGENGET